MTDPKPGQTQTEQPASPPIPVTPKAAPLKLNQTIREDARDTFERLNGNSTTLVGGLINILKNYRWTLSRHRDREDVPYIWLREFNSNETYIQKQLGYYSQLGFLAVTERAKAAAGVASLKEPLDIYKEIFPHSDRENCHDYILPYFSKTNVELGTPTWSQIDPVGEVLQESAEQVVSSGVKFLAGKEAGKTAGNVMGSINQGMNLLTGLAKVVAMAQYPLVGAHDRPRIFGTHSERTITVSFPLFNTVEKDEWKANQKFIHTLMNQNLMYKTSYVTGVPPVFYDVFIPGQYYCWASCVTNIQVENLGNTRMLEASIVPDAYQVSVTFSEMVVPSKNQFDARFTGDTSFGKVNVTAVGVTTEGAKEQLTKLAKAAGIQYPQ
jgi:hypothetical protein